MTGPDLSGIERAVFGDVERADVDAWLDRHVRARLGGSLARVLFRSGRIDAVYGVALGDGREVAVKVHRNPADPAYLTAAVACQQRLFDAGYPCPRPLDGPATTAGLTGVVEDLLDDGDAGDGHDPRVRAAMARSLHDQVDLLRESTDAVLQAGAPAWIRYQHGPWPTPHDPIFDFTTTPIEHGWIVDLARRAAAVLADAGPADCTAHADWNCGNTRFSGGRVSAAYDWDSLASAPEPVLVGLSAIRFPQGSTSGAETATTAEVLAFFDDYEQARGRRFTPAEQQTAAAAITWVLAYNARCEVAFLPAGQTAAAGSALEALTTHRDAYLALRW